MTRVCRHTGLSITLAACITISAVAGFGAERAQAQMFSSMSRGGAAGMVVSKRSLEEYSELLGLSAEQKATIKTLHEGYRAAVDAMNEEFEGKQEAIQEKARDGDMSVFQKELPELMKEQAEKSRGLTKQFLDDMKATLTPEQSEKWPSVERTRRRETGMIGGFFSGADVDLVSLAKSEHVDVSGAGVIDAIEAYETEMDQKLKEIEIQRSEMRKMDDKGGAITIAVVDDGGGAKVSGDNRLKVIAEQSKMLRDINERHVQKIGAALSDEDRAKFEQAFERRAYPRIYKQAYAMDLLEAAGGMDDLSAEQQAKIAAARQQYESRLKSLNQTWEESQRTAEEVSGIGGMGLMMMGFGGGDKGDEASKARKALNEARKARRDLDKATEKKVRDALNADQKDRLPQKRQDDGEEGPGGVRIEIGGHGAWQGGDED